jgi:hypothetical protein
MPTPGNSLNIKELGYQSFDGVSVFKGRTLTAGPGVSIINGDGVAGNTTISATGSGGTVTSVTGTTNRITSTGGTTPVIDISASYVGQSSITTLGTVTSGIWNGTAIDATHGGTAQTTYATGDILYASGVNTLTKLTAGSNTNVLTLAAGVPSWAAPATSGTVTSVSGTANQVAVATGTTTPVISLIGPYTPATYTAHGVLIGEGTGSIVALAAGSVGQVLQSGGASANPLYSTATFPSTATGTGTILRADGINWSASTSTYPNTNAVNTLLYASSANVMSALTTANSGVLATSSSGVPSIDTTNFAVLSTGLQLKGNNTNTAPPAGFIGEQIRSYIVVGSAISLVNATAKNITSILLTAGIWDVSSIVAFLNPGTTSVVFLETSINTSTNAISGAYGDSDGFFQESANIGLQMSISIPSYRVTISSNTTYYLNARATFSASTYTACGRISATRVG